MVERNEISANLSDFKTTSQQRSGNSMKMAFTCAKLPSSCVGQVTFVNSEAYTMMMAMRSGASGKAENLAMDSSGKWLGTDCGTRPSPFPA